MSDFQDDHDPGAVWRLPVSDTTILLVELTTGEPVLRQRDLLAPRADAVRPPSREYRGRRTGENSGPGPGWSVTGPDDSAGVEYDPAGRPVRHTDAAGAVTAFSWDDEHRLTGLTDAAGTLVRLSYTAAGAVSEVVLEGVGRTGFAYQDEPAGPAGSGGPAAGGTRTVVTDPIGRATAYTFDGHGRLLTVTDPLGGIHRQEWDPAGRLAAAVDRTGGRTAYEYDGHGRLVARVAPTSARSSVDYGDPAHPDLVTTLRDPAGNEVVLEHDTAGRVVRAGTAGTAVTAGAADATGTADTAGAAGSLDRRDYDPVHGRISSVTNGAGHRTSFEYDAAGELVAVSPPAPRRRASYDYDEFGRVVAVTGGNGRRTAYRHDPVGRLVEVSGPGGVLLTQTHDPVGRIVRRAGAGWRYDYSWVSTSAGSRLAAVVRTDDAGREEVRAEHGPDGALRSLTTAGGTTAYDYDPAGRLAGVRTPTGHQARFTRDAAGRALRIEFGGAVQEISYDAAGRRRALTLLGADGATLLSAEYDYRDPTGADGDRLRRLVLDGQVTEYAYDPLGQLVQAGSTSYAYDAALNLVRLGETAFTIGAAGEVTRFGATEFDYDGAGNFVEEVNPTGSFRYSDTNQTVLGIFGGAIVADIAHDGLGQQTPRRVTETTVDGRTVTHVLTHGPLGVARVVDDGVPLDVVRLPDGTVLAVITAEGRLLWTVTDHQGSVLALVDEQGRLAARYGYTPHGAVTATGPDAATNPFRYRGAYQLLRSAHFLDNRLYNGYWGRFTQPDPTGRQYGPY
ncbi:hypothetical protein AB1484_32550 [Parafrankia sp. FMc6]|uniref:hypothetical protein n=1 Tax=Parafrankia soli TaxID=2599596 RepID=UPI0034D58713